MRHIRALLGALPALSIALASSPSFAAGAGDAPGIAMRSLGDVDKESETVKQVIANAKASERSPEQRIADADILLKSRDYGRAINTLMIVVEKYADHPTAYPDALAMLGETYFQSHQLLSARREFNEIVTKRNESRMQPYVPQAFTRLVDIALRMRDAKALDDLLTKMGQSGDATVSYAKAKAYISKKDWGNARTAAQNVPAQHPLYHQAKYLLGLIAMREAQAQAGPQELKPGEAPPPAPPTRYAAAIEAFRQVTQLPPDTPEHRQVIDFAWLAIGRLFYEADQWLEAADAYNHVDRQSPEFGTSLYELAWVYVRLGDSDRATRALEILSIADPNNAYLADGTLLRADLMLRSGQFDKALTVYQNVRAEYDPMREKVDAFLGSTTDPSAYYDKLANEQLDMLDNTTSALPLRAVEWAREEKDGPAAFALLDDVQQCRELIRQSQTLVAKLRLILNAPNRVRAFPDLKAGDERALELLNRISVARATLGQGLDDAEPREVSGELAQVRQERRELQKRVLQLPTTDGDMAEREASAQRQWNKVSQNLQQAQLEVDQIQAIVNGIRRMIADGMVGNRDPATIAQWRSELDQNERDLRAYKDAIDSTRKRIEFGRVQVGYGDSRFVEDEQVRNAYRDKLQQELQLVASGAAGASAQSFASRAQPVMEMAATSESRIVGMRRDIDVEVQKRSTEAQQVVDTEAAHIASYQDTLARYDAEARVVVGNVAMRNFGLVRDKLKGIVLRADVGAVEEAWQVREEQLARVRNLQVERVREEQVLQQELREVLDDSADPAPGPGAPNP